MTAQELMKQYLVQVMQRVHHKKHNHGISPNIVMWQELTKEIIEDSNDAMKLLVDEGKVHAGRTLNDNYFRLT